MCFAADVAFSPTNQCRSLMLTNILKCARRYRRYAYANVVIAIGLYWIDCGIWLYGRGGGFA